MTQLNEILHNAYEQHRSHPELRLGQCISNAATSIYPGWSFALANSRIDCFYNDKNIHAYTIMITTLEEEYLDKLIPESQVESMIDNILLGIEVTEMYS